MTTLLGSRRVAGLCIAAMLAIALSAVAGCSVGDEPPRTKTAEPASAETLFDVTELELPYRSFHKPQKLGRDIYATTIRGVDQGESLIKYNMDSGEAETIIEAEDLIGWFVVNEDWLVWSEGLELFSRPLAGGTTRVVSAARDLYAPSLQGDLLAWQHLTEDRTHQIVVQNLRSEETTVIADLVLADLYNNFPAWDNGRLVWTDVIDDQGCYFVYDKDTGETTRYDMPDVRYRYPGYAMMAGDRIYSINFDRVDEWHWVVQQFGYYSITDGTWVPLVDEGTFISVPVVSDEYIAIEIEGTPLKVQSTTAEIGAEWHEPVPDPRAAYNHGSLDGTFIVTTPDFEAARTRVYVIEPKK